MIISFDHNNDHNNNNNDNNMFPDFALVFQ